MSIRPWFVAIWLSACIDSGATVCQDFVVCPAGTVCTNLNLCLEEVRVEACATLPDRATCGYLEVEGHCRDFGGVLACAPIGCGNYLMDDGEVCDDGNRVSGDGCSADCASTETCGNAIPDFAVGEQCDAGSANSEAANAACRTSCRAAICGDGVIDDARFEVCDTGAANSDVPDAACRLDCRPGRCGDGIVDAGRAEACDDGNTINGDGCAADCGSREECGNGVVDIAAGEQCDVAPGSADCTIDCQLPNCGDGNIDPLELCDDGAANSNAADAACRLYCRPAACGDGIRDIVGGELCDDGNTVTGDACGLDCRSSESCGNGLVDAVYGEQCDDGSNLDGDGCQADCQIARCGDGVIDPLEECDAGIANDDAPGATCRATCRLPGCGDGVLEAGEFCDDGNRVSGDGCSVDCASHEDCGNGVVDVLVGEQCDDGNVDDGDGCQATCQLARCGDFVRDPGEACDDGTGNADIAGAGCLTNCTLPGCGDGIFDPTLGEVCDDGAQVSGDGCSADCRSNETCGNGLVDVSVGEQCDDANARSHDGCASGCQFESLTWLETTPRVLPYADRAPMAFNPNTKLTVGYFVDEEGQGEGTFGTWAWDRRRMDPLSAEAEPGMITGHQLAYDPTLDQFVMFGGGPVSGGFSDETWVLNDVKWEAQGQVPTRGGRFGHGLIYDETRGEIVLFGGQTASGPESTMAAWAGTFWKDVAVSGPSFEVLNPAYGYDRTRGLLVVVGGIEPATGNPLRYVWEFDGTRWTERTDVPSPNANSINCQVWAQVSRFVCVDRSGSLTAYDGVSFAPVGDLFTAGQVLGLVQSDQLLVLARLDATTHALFSLEGPNWVERGRVGRPAGAAVVGTVGMREADAVLMSGTFLASGKAETWELKADVWNRLATTNELPAFADVALAYVFEDNLVLASVILPSQVHETWTWDGTGWMQLAGDEPTATSGVTRRMAYDPVLGVVVLTGTDDGKMYRWAGAWTGLVATLTPRAGAAIAHDRADGITYLFGGLSQSLPLADHLGWTGSEWFPVASAGTPGPRFNVHMAYAHALASTILLGCGTSCAGSVPTYRWREGTWSPVAGTAPPATVGQMTEYRDGTLIIDTQFDVWSFGLFNGAVVADRCSGGTDLDQDGLSGCDDPDCWPWCDPTCPHGEACDPDRPRCGDGSCDLVLEGVNRCPADCGP